MQVGKKLGRYEIRQKIGEGGMGEVYLAYDAQLNREVVVKLLLKKFTEDRNLVARFKQEAKAVSALNHPNIITIYEIVEADGLLFIVYEYIKGKTLREKIERNLLSVDDSVKIIEQVAQGLIAAHQAGIIHRDIKPENIMIRDDGYVKILDFGLAKRSFINAKSESKTAHQIKTVEGAIMGSVQYMSPEQARGEKMDERTDIFSLGVVFYEMLTGISPFDAKTLTDSLSKVISHNPEPLNQINSHIPPNLQKVTEKALKKKREERYQNIQHFLLGLHGLNVPTEEAVEDRQKTAVFDEPRQNTNNENTVQHTKEEEVRETIQQDKVKTVPKKNYALWALFAAIPILFVGAGVLVLAGFGVYYYSTFFETEVPFSKIQVEPLTKDKNADLVSMTNDGKYVAFVKDFSGNPTLTVREMSSGKESEIIQPKDGGFNSVNISNDGKWIYYVLQKGADTMLYRILLKGGEPEKMGNGVHSAVKFTPDGIDFIYLQSSAAEGLTRVFVANLSGANLQEIISSKDLGYDTIADFAVSPDGNRLFLALLGKDKQNRSIISLGTIGINTKNSQQISDKKFQLLNNEGWRSVQSAKWLKNGAGILFNGGNSISKTKQIYHLAYPSGKIKQITNDTSNYNSLDFSDDAKTMIASKAKILGGMWKIDYKTGNAKQFGAENETLLNFANISVSKDKRIYFPKIEGDSINIFSMDLQGEDVKQITKKGWHMGAYITPDGKYILTTGKTLDNFYGLVRMNLDGTNPVFLTKIKDKMDIMPTMSADGETVVFMRLNVDWRFPKIMKVSINGGEVSALINDNQKSEMYPQVSPNGKYIAFLNSFLDSTTNQVKMHLKIASFSGNKVGKVIHEKEVPQITRFLWAKNSRHLIYIEPTKKNNLIKISLASKKETPVTAFDVRVMEGAMVFSADAKEIYAVRSFDTRELVLIKNISEN